MQLLKRLKEKVDSDDLLPEQHDEWCKRYRIDSPPADSTDQPTGRRRTVSFAASREKDQRKYLIEEVQGYLDAHEHSEVQEERWRTSFSRKLGGLDSAVNANAASIDKKVGIIDFNDLVRH